MRTTITILFVFCSFLCTGAEKFTVKINEIEKFSNMFRPIRAIQGLQFEATVAYNVGSTNYSVSIDKAKSFWGDARYFEIVNNNQTIQNSGTITFKINVSTIAFAERQYKYKLFLNAISSDTTYSFNSNEFTITIDNSQPEYLDVAQSGCGSTHINVSFNSNDIMSKEYTDKNKKEGKNGIFTYFFRLSKGGSQVYNITYSAATGNSYKFTNLSPNCTYKLHTIATDMAGNYLPLSEEVTLTTAPAPPANLRCTAKTFCTANLAWNASAGATSYKVFNASSNALLGSTSSTQWSMGNLKAGSTYKYYVQAVGNAGTSDKSSTLSVTTPSVPTPTISGPQTVCGSTATYTVSQIPTGCSIRWVSSGQLTLQSSSGLNATFVANGNAAATVSAYFSTCGGNGATTKMNIWVGKPLTPIIIGDNTLECMQRTIYVDDNRNYVQWSVTGATKLYGASSGYKCTVRGERAGFGWITAKATNSCGSSESRLLVEVTGDRFSVSPNPASNTITVAVDATTRAKDDSNRINTVQIFSQMGNLELSENFENASNVTLNIGRLRKGVYVVLVNGTHRQTIIKE